MTIKQLKSEYNTLTAITIRQKDFQKLFSKYAKTPIKNISDLNDVLYIANDVGMTLEVATVLNGALFTRKNIFDDYNYFSYLDETESNMKSAQAKKFWSAYLKKHNVLFLNIG